jgi:hypothetical protein
MRSFVFASEKFRGTDIGGVGVIVRVGIDVGVGGGVGDKVILSFPVGFKLAISEARTFGIPIPIIMMMANVITCRFMSYVYRMMGKINRFIALPRIITCRQ